MTRPPQRQVVTVEAIDDRGFAQVVTDIGARFPVQRRFHSTPGISPQPGERWVIEGDGAAFGFVGKESTEVFDIDRTDRIYGPPRGSLLWDDWADLGEGQAVDGRVTATGHTWVADAQVSRRRGTLMVTSGETGRAAIDLGASPSRVEVDVGWHPVGTQSGQSGVGIYISGTTPDNTISVETPDEAVVLFIKQTSWTVYSFRAGGAETLATGVFVDPLALGARMRVALVMTDTSLQVELPDGSRTGVAQSVLPRAWETVGVGLTHADPTDYAPQCWSIHAEHHASMGLTGVVDVAQYLTSPSDPTTTTAEIEALGRELWENGGGVLWFAPGDYYIDGIEPPDDSSDPWWIRLATPYYLNPFDRGGIRLRANVSLIGAPGARLVWGATSYNSACMIGADDPFDDAASLAINQDVEPGQYQFGVSPDPTEFYSVDDQVQIRLGQVPGDTRECEWWAFAKVTAVDAASITLDVPAGVAVDLGEMFQQAYGDGSSGDPATSFTGHAYDFEDEIADSFDRADSALTLGSTDTGEAWGHVGPSGGVLGISGNRAYMVTADGFGANVGYVDTGEVDQHVKADIEHNDSTGTVAMFARFDHTTFSGYYVYFVAGTSMGLSRLDTGTPTPLDDYNPVGGLPDICRVAIVCEGDEIRVFLNGVLIMSATDATYSYTEAGFNLNLAGAYVDNFTAGTTIWPNYRAAWIRKFRPGRFVENVTIEGLELVREGGRDGTNSPQGGILLHHCRGVTVRRVRGANTGTALINQYETEACHIEDIQVDEAYDVDPPVGYYGFGLAWAATRAATGRNLRVFNHHYDAIHTEQRGEVALRDVVVANGNPGFSGPVISCFNGNRLTIERIEVRGKSGNPYLFHSPGPVDRLVVRDLTYACDSADGLDLSYLEGRLRLRTDLNGTWVDESYLQRQWQGTFPIKNTGAYTSRLPIPDGPIRRARIYVSDLADVASVALISDPGGSGGAYLWEADLDPDELATDQTSELGRIFGGGQAFNLIGVALADDMVGREIRVIGSASVAAGQWGTIVVDYFAPDPAALGAVEYTQDANQWDGHHMGSLVDVPGLLDTLGYIGGW